MEEPEGPAIIHIHHLDFGSLLIPFLPAAWSCLGWELSSISLPLFFHFIISFGFELVHFAPSLIMHRFRPVFDVSIAFILPHSIFVLRALSTSTLDHLTNLHLFSNLSSARHDRTEEPRAKSSSLLISPHYQPVPGLSLVVSLLSPSSPPPSAFVSLSSLLTLL